MKKIILVLIVNLIGTTNFIFSQVEISKQATTSLTINDVYNATEIMYYGFDFSNFRLVEPDRINEGADIKNQFPAWNSFVFTELTMHKMAKWFKKTKIEYNSVAVNAVNNKVNDKNVVARLPFKSEISDIQNTIYNYEKPNNPKNLKIGMVVSVEYFQKKPREAAAYVIFFDISNGVIVDSKRITTKDVSDGKGITAYWGQSCSIIIKEYVDRIYSKGL